MADLAQVLLLPPPAPQRSTLPAREATDLTVSAEAPTGDAARARRFRFRVYEGGDSGDAAQTATSRVGAGRITLVSDNASSAETDADASGLRRGGTGTYTRLSGNPSSAFLAQSIAQEQLGDGLYNPPNRQATLAYTRAATALQPRLSAGIDLQA
jgi:hypothetical protein